MPIYHQLGSAPAQAARGVPAAGRRAVRRGADRQQGFSGPSSLLYHLHQPTHVKSRVQPLRDLQLGARSRAAVPSPAFPHASARVGRQHHARSRAAAVQQRRGDARSCSPIAKTTSSTATRRATKSCSSARAPACSRRSSARSPFSKGDYLVIPRGILHRYTFTATPSRCLVIESAGYVRTPKRYRNEHGQLTEIGAVLGARHPAARRPPDARREAASSGSS